jgi:hypothetical protein
MCVEKRPLGPFETDWARCGLQLRHQPNDFDTIPFGRIFSRTWGQPPQVGRTQEGQLGIARIQESLTD